MKKTMLLLSLMMAATGVRSQYTVRLVVNTVATRPQDDIYVSGNFNNWNPRDENYKLKPFAGSRKSIVIKDMAAGTYAFKFTRGGSEKVECMPDGRDINDRVLEVKGDVSMDIIIAGWKDDYPDRPKRYTATPQVHLMDTAFSIPQLARKRRIWIYLPKGYATSSKTYPVLYMHDGQDLFNEQTAAAGEWGVDECLDTLQQKINKECIVVGIENDPGHRMTEYNPCDDAIYGKGEGKAYVDFLANTLKPYVDSKYRTRKSPENNFVAGSGMGAVISLYAVMQYPGVFGGAGIFSPAFASAPLLYTEAEKFSAATLLKFYFYAGSKENAGMVDEMHRMTNIFEKKQQYNIRSIVYPPGQHNEKYWSEEFPGFYQWIMQ